MRQGDAVGERNPASDFGEDMLVAPVGERSPQLQISEGVGCRSGFMARGPADGNRTELERKLDFSFSQRASRCTFMRIGGGVRLANARGAS